MAYMRSFGNIKVAAFWAITFSELSIKKEEYTRKYNLPVIHIS